MYTLHLSRNLDRRLIHGRRRTHRHRGRLEVADRLGAVLQDDTGHSLTGQRLLSLREELVSFENLVSMARPGRRPS